MFDGFGYSALMFCAGLGCPCRQNPSLGRYKSAESKGVAPVNGFTGMGTEIALLHAIILSEAERSTANAEMLEL